MHDSVTFRFRETSKYSHRYGQTCSTYVIATAHACGLVEGTLARDHGELVARSRNTRGVRYIVSKEIVIKTCYKTVQHLLSLATFVLRIGQPLDFENGLSFGFSLRGKDRETRRIELPRQISDPNCQIFLYNEKTKKINYLLSLIYFSIFLSRGECVKFRKMIETISIWDRVFDFPVGVGGNSFSRYSPV